MKKIWGVRSGLIGDIIISLPVVSFIKQKHPDSYLYFVIDKKHEHCSSLFKDHPLIDEIRITEKEGEYGDEDLKIMESCDIVFNCSPEGLCPYWWNFDGLNLVHATWIMAGLRLEDYFKMPEEQKIPKLYRWWDRKPISGGKNIALWPIAAYTGGDMSRNPSLEQWREINSKLISEGYNIFQFGWHENPTLGEGENYQDCSKLPFVEQIQKSLDCDMALGIESGATWAIAAYGEIPQLNLLIMSDHHDHYRNPTAWHPLGKKSESIYVTNNWKNLDLDQVIDCVKKIV